jgi:putative tricarboxylic transport membrane protein
MCSPSTLLHTSPVRPEIEEIPMLHYVWIAVSELGHVQSLGMLALGCLVGYVFGVLPGLGGTAAMALCLPLIYGMRPGAALYLLGGIMGAVTCGGAVTAVLLNTPGTAVNAATCLDGYPMAQRGEAGRAISIASFSSLLGGAFGIITLIVLVPVMRAVVMAFSPPELFMMALLGLVTATVAIRGHIIKGLISTTLGLLIAFIGFSHVTGAVRFAFGSEFLYDGVPIIPFFVGLFALGEMLWIASTGREQVSSEPIRVKGGRLAGFMDVVRCKKVFFLGSVIGTIIGIIPGVGGSVANFVSYLFGRQVSKTPEKFGSGWAEGIVASESAGNAKDGGALVPTLAFGVPGSAEMAVLLGGLILIGVTPGPTIMLEHLDLVWSIIVALTLGHIISATGTIFIASHLAKLTKVSFHYLIPSVVILCFLGAFALRESMIDVFCVIVFGVLGYGMKRGGFPIIPMVIGFVLGGIAEVAFLQTLMVSSGSLTIFVTRPLSLALLALTLFVIAVPFLSKHKVEKKYTASAQ